MQPGASFLGPTQLSVTCSTEKEGEPCIFSRMCIHNQKMAKSCRTNKICFAYFQQTTHSILCTTVSYPYVVSYLVPWLWCSWPSEPHTQSELFYHLFCPDITHVRKDTRPSPTFLYSKWWKAGWGLETRLASSLRRMSIATVSVLVSTQLQETFKRVSWELNIYLRGLAVVQMSQATYECKGRGGQSNCYFLVNLQLLH